MKKRLKKKRVKRNMDRFTREIVPGVFRNEAERREYVSACARHYVGQRWKVPTFIARLSEAATMAIKEA